LCWQVDDRLTNISSKADCGEKASWALVIKLLV
jgi:hypothetical protein